MGCQQLPFPLLPSHLDVSMALPEGSETRDGGLGFFSFETSPQLSTKPTFPL